MDGDMCLSLIFYLYIYIYIRGSRDRERCTQTTYHTKILVFPCGFFGVFGIFYCFEGSKNKVPECNEKRIMNIFAFCFLMQSVNRRMFLGWSNLGKESRNKEYILLLDNQCCMKADLKTCIPVNSS